MRLDKFLKMSRIVKRRGISKEFITNGVIFVNDKLKKPSYEVKEGDIIEVRLRSKLCKLKVIDPNPRVNSREACKEV
ncbi:MAG: RNA-binding S4 domain-containing protein [Epsilonproteobacteria bacterium]|nr:RNA-binding S4 domain-containing protein [Campylobacterota bacterium]